jgi:hypothetical protein
VADKPWDEMPESEKLEWLKAAIEQVATMVRSIEPATALSIKRVEERLGRLEGKERSK